MNLIHSYTQWWRRKQFLNGGLQLGKENMARDRQAISTNMPRKVGGGLQPLEPPFLRHWHMSVSVSDAWCVQAS